MSSEIWLTLVSIAIGTYLIRLVPYLWMQRKLAQSQNENTLADTPDWLTVLGPAMIAAMFGTSLVPVHPGLVSWIASAAGIVATLLVWRKTRSMGLPTFAGVLAFGLVKVMFG